MKLGPAAATPPALTPSEAKMDAPDWRRLTKDRKNAKEREKRALVGKKAVADAGKALAALARATPSGGGGSGAGGSGGPGGKRAKKAPEAPAGREAGAAGKAFVVKLIRNPQATAAATMTAAGATADDPEGKDEDATAEAAAAPDNSPDSTRVSQPRARTAKYRADVSSRTNEEATTTEEATTSAALLALADAPPRGRVWRILLATS